MTNPHPNKAKVGMETLEDLSRLNAVRLIVVLLIGVGYSSTMAVGPDAKEWLNTFGYDPSLFGLQVLFFLSGWLAWRSLSQGRTLLEFMASRARRNWPWIVFYTFIVVAFLYPALCDPGATTHYASGGLVLYFLKTVTLVAPGHPMPGALDQALYACQLQGAIWALRWGVIAYAGLLMLYTLRLRHGAVFAALFIITLIFHFGANSWTDQTGSDLLKPITIGLRLGFPFLLGICAYNSARFFPRKSAGWAALGCLSLAMAAVNYYLLTWTYAIEVLASIGWSFLAMALVQSDWKVLKNWPNVALPVFLGVWPITQFILAMLPQIEVPALVIMSLSTALAIALILSNLSSIWRKPVHRRVQPA